MTKKLIGSIIVALFATTPGSAADSNWLRQQSDVEFSLVTDVAGSITETPSTLQTGYDGAWWFGGPEIMGVAQTFNVPSQRALKSLSLRFWNNIDGPTAGEFKISILRFNPVTELPIGELAAITADAALYSNRTDIKSTFDFSSFNIQLLPTDTYAFLVSPTPTFTGGLMTLHAAPNIYAGGTTYTVRGIPEPTSTLLVVAAVGCFSCWPFGRRRLN